MWESDAWIRVVLGYMIAGEREYRVGFLDGSEVRGMKAYASGYIATVQVRISLKF